MTNKLNEYARSTFHATRRGERFRVYVAAPVFAAACVLVGIACKSSSSSSGGMGTQNVTFHGAAPLFSGFSFDTGLIPAGSPVQVELSLKADGETDVDAAGKTGGSGSDLTVYGTPGSGKVTLKGKFALEGQLNANVSGLPSYNGPIPGFDNVDIEFNQAATFDPFLVGGTSHVDAPIPPAMLPSIPLPGGIPGDLVIAIEDGSVVSADFSGTCAAFDGKNAHYTGTVTTTGTLKLKPTVEIKVPLLGTKSFDIPEIVVAIPSKSAGLDLGSPAAAEGDGSKPMGDAAKKGTCMPVMGGTGGAGGTSGTGTTTNTSQASTGNTTATGSPTTTASTGSGGSCDSGSMPDMTACSACQTCSQNSVCMTETNNCTNDSACMTLLNCEAACTPNDTACFNGCENAAPAASLTTYNVLYTCTFCTACPISCDGKAAGCP